MLEMKKECENCGAALRASSDDAMICSFECTFCKECSTNLLGGICPNCEGELVKRPIRERREACSIEAIYQARQETQEEDIDESPLRSAASPVGTQRLRPRRKPAADRNGSRSGRTSPLSIARSTSL